MEIAVAGLGYVGLSNAVLLAGLLTVEAIDLSKESVRLVNMGESPIVDAELEASLANWELKLAATTYEETYDDADFAITAIPTYYNLKRNHFDTSNVETVIKQVLLANRMAGDTIDVEATAFTRDQFGAA